MFSFKYYFNFKLVGNFFLKLESKRKFKIPNNWKSDILSPPLNISNKTKYLIKKHYLEGRYVKGARHVAWVTSGAPVEILKAFDFYVLYPENHGAICGVRKVSPEISSEAEKRGYSQDICSYARTDIGSILSGRTPVGYLPPPDVLFACTNICQTVLYWYQALSKYFQVPLILIDTPFLYKESYDYQVNFVKDQLENSIPILEEISGKKLNFKKLKKVVKLSKDATELWLEIIKKGKSVPAPISAFDQFIHMAPIVEMRGEKETVDFYYHMLKEVDEKVKKGIGAVKNERKRLLWDNLPIWYKLRFLSEFLGQYGVSVVFSTYTNAWGELAPLIDPERPIASMSKTYLYPILNRGTKHKLDVMLESIREYKIDGVILHSDRSCKPYSIGQIDQRNILVSKYKVPGILIESDHNDYRIFSEKQVLERLKTFLELLGV